MPETKSTRATGHSLLEQCLSLLSSAALIGERSLGPFVVPPVRRLKANRAQRAVDAAGRARTAMPAWAADEPRWSPFGAPPRLHNRLTPLIDGESFFDALCAAIESATDYVYVASWCLTPHLPLRRGTPGDVKNSRLVTVLSEAARRVPVRVLLWGGAPFFLQPTSRSVEEAAEVLERQAGGDLQCRLDKTASKTHSHHQKAVVIDGQLAFLGGTDLTTSAGDRWDQRTHPLRAGVNWHDATVLLEGEAVADVEANFRQRWQDVTGDTALPSGSPKVDPAWSTPAQVVRTIPAGDYEFAPQGEFGIHHSYLTLIREARRFIYLESQYLWSTEIVEALIDKVQRPPSPQFRIVIVLPARATSGKWDNDKHVQDLRSADAGRGIVSVFSLYTGGPTTGAKPFRYRPVYVHAKLGVIDDEWLFLGSANLNDRGLHSDSEIAVVAHDPDLARSLRLDLWREHLGPTVANLEDREVAAVIDSEWRDHAARNEAIIAAGEEPLLSSVHRYVAGKPAGAWILEETQSLTFEH